MLPLGPYIVVTIALVGGVLINELGYSLVGSITGIDHVILPWGESVAIMSRPRSLGTFTNWFSLALYAGVVSVHL